MNILLCLALLGQVPQPRLGSTQPCGAKAGATVEVKITSGSDLERIDRLVFSHPGITSEPVMTEGDRFFERRPVENLFRVKVAAGVPPGLYEVRASGQYGMSNARRFAIGDLEEALEKEPNNSAETAQPTAAGTTINGACDASGFDLFKLDLKKGKRLIVDGLAQRIDSRALVVLTLHSPSGRRLARASAARERDPLLDVMVEEDGVHTLSVNDATYRGGDDFFYRLNLVSGPWIDFADPPVVKAGAETEVTLYGRNLPGGSPAEGVSLDGRPLEKLSVKVKAPAEPTATDLSGGSMRPADSTADLFVYRLGGSNAVRLLASAEAPAREPEADSDKPVALPFQVLGRLHPAGDRDAYVFEAKKGEKLWIEIVSQRLGLPTDPALTIQQIGDAGPKDLQDVDDAAPTGAKMGEGMEKRYRLTPDDPSLLWTAPADGKFRVLVRDLYGGGSGDPRWFYHLSIRPARQDFRLVAFPIEGFMAENKMSSWSNVLRRGGADRMRVIAYRREGFDGPIRLEAEDLPKGVSARPVVMGPGEASAEFLLHAAPDAPAYAGVFRIVGKAEVDGKQICRPARGAEIVWSIADTQKEGVVTRLTDRLSVAVDDRFTTPFEAKLGTQPLYRMARGGKLKVPVKLAKQADFKDADKAKVKLAPVGIPGGKDNNNKPVVAKEVTLEPGKPEGEIEIDITEKAALGTFTFYVAGEVQMPFKPGAERVKIMEADKKRVDEVAKQIADEMKAAEKARTAADEKVKETAKALEAARQKLEKAKKENAADLAEQEKAVKAAEESAKAAEDAKKKLADAEAKAKEMVKAADTTTKKLADDMKKATDAAKEKNVKVWIASLPITVEVVALPASLQLPATAAVKAGQTVEIAAKLLREFGAADEAKLELQAPGDAKLKLADAAFAKDAADAKLSISADKGAKVGKHAATLRAKLTFNGKPVTVEQALTVEISEAPPEPKPEPKPEVKPEPKKEEKPKPEAKPEVKPAPKPEAAPKSGSK